MSSKHNKKKRNNGKSAYVFTVLKYVFAIIFPLLAVIVNHSDSTYILLAFAEIVFIFITTNLLLRIKYIIGYLFNCISLFFINVQFGFLFFGNSFISLNMLENVDSIKDLGGKFIYYGIAIVFIGFFTFFPVKKFSINIITESIIAVSVIALYVFIILTNRYSFSPIYFTYDLINQQIARSKMEKLVTDSGNGNNEFLKTEVEDFVEKPDNLSDKPNVILVLTEGLSENVIEDKRNITPNIKALEKKSISFSNYYNHTFATYMALSGQFYSGYQQNNYDVNNLTSIQDIFKDYGYNTSIINTEPKNKEFSDYLANFKYDEVITDNSMIDGMADSISDKSAYELLLSTAENKNKSGTPFFISMYSFGTHATLDSVHNKFENGDSNFLNRFYDLDIQLGKFVEKFEKSDLFDNTIFIFTADHCSYKDTDFSAAFPNYSRKSTVVDRMPFMIYYKGVSATSYDVNGRNSLDMTPTVLDFLDMTGENSFLGESLFSFDKNTSKYNTVFQSYATYFSTKDCNIRDLTSEERTWFEPELIKYFSIKLNDNSILNDYANECHIYGYLSSDKKTLNLDISNLSEVDGLQIAVWSEDNGQDDIKWFNMSYKKGEKVTYSVDFSSFKDTGTYSAHIYGTDSKTKEQKLLGGISFIVN